MSSFFKGWIAKNGVARVAGVADDSAANNSNGLASSPSDTPSPTADMQRVTSCSSPIASISADTAHIVTPLHLLSSPLMDADYFQQAYYERAAIHECDGLMPRAEAEQQAYQSSLEVFIRANYPMILAQFDALIFSPTMQ